MSKEASAPTAYSSSLINVDDNVLFNRPPPPSYEESQRKAPVMPMQAPQQQFYFPGQPFPHTQMGSVIPPAYDMYGAQGGLNYQQPMNAYSYQPTFAPGVGFVAQGNAGQAYLPAGSMAGNHVIEFAKGAELRTTKGGAVSVPPPPPGCAPTPAQLAAMQGQSVLVKEPKKRGFF